MAANRMDSLDEIFDDHPSLSASLEDFENNENASPVFRLPSQHSGFKSDDSEADVESNSEGPWSPPAWKQQNTGSGWYRHQPYQQTALGLGTSGSPSRSREASPKYESAREDEADLTIPANIPLPRDSMSPVKERSRSPSPYVERKQDSREMFGQAEPASPVAESPSNYIRFAVRAEVQQRTEPLEAVFSCIQTYYKRFTKTWSSLTLAISVVVLSTSILRTLFQPPAQLRVPDLVNVAGLARNFEPMIYYSENGVHQIADLQETGVAVWDLGESMRTANMTSAPQIVSALNNLSSNLRTLSVELTRFFANVDGDVDSILLVMDWAKRELSALSSSPPTALSSAFSNIHSLFSRLGVLEDTSTGLPTAVGKLMTDLFGATPPQRNREALRRTFLEFVGTLEASINNELRYSLALNSLFESIDQEFLNIRSSVARETDTQERLESEFLSSLWTRVLGPNASTLRKYEKNKLLLSDVQSRTNENKKLLREHSGKLEMLKANLNRLRQQLFSPLIQGETACSLSVEEQIRGLDGTYELLKGVREKQKSRLMELLYKVGSRRVVLGKENTVEIDAR